jgi:hypothetical protein
MGTSGKSRPYSELGKMLDALARSRDVRGPYNIAYHLKEVAGYEVSGQSVSKLPIRGILAQARIYRCLH